MLAIALAAAVASMPLVPPDELYLGYFDWKTIGCLFCVLAMASAFRRIGTFDRIARIALSKFSDPRKLMLVVVLTTAAFSMAFTNDVALVIMLPLSASVLVKSDMPYLVPAAFAMQTLAANLCGMITPFGNPQNLYLYSYYHISLWEFLRTMAPPFLLSVVGIILVTQVLAKRTITKRDSSEADCERDGGASKATRSNPEMPLDRRRLKTYSLLFVLVLLAVFRIVPFLVAVVAVALILAFADRRALAEVDYSLLVTFLCFFVFAGNVARIPALGDALVPLLDQWGLLVSAGLSQVISNVPAAVVLSHFTSAWQPLLVGVNVGGAGTFIGSLASLIAIRYFTTARKVFPALRAEAASSTKGFLMLFGTLNVSFLVVLVLFCQLCQLI